VIKISDIQKTTEDIIRIFKENKVLKVNADYRKLYSDLCKFLRGLVP